MNTPTTITVEIPADARDNSETVTDYAFMRHHAQSNYPYHTVKVRDEEIKRVDLFPHLRFTRYTWTDVNPDEQRCRFDMIVDPDGMVVNLFHTEYFTRVACILHEANYATFYASVTDGETGETTTEAPYCDECMTMMLRSSRDHGDVVNTSERLRIGQHN